jgi:acetyl esterase/lipase
MADDLFAMPTVLPPPVGARIRRDRTYRTDAHGDLLLDAYLPATGNGRWPAVLLINGDAEEPVIARAKEWAIFRSYGEHLAARGLVGVPFNHRSTRTVGRPEVAVEVTAALDHIRANAKDLEIDAARIGVWAFSAAGAFALAPLLRARPPYVKAIAGFYTVWDLSAFQKLDPRLTDTEVQEWSATEALGATIAGLPPILVAIAGRDNPPFISSAESFVKRAADLGADVRVHRHPEGKHGFDLRDDDERSRVIIREALDFFASTLAETTGI